MNAAVQLPGLLTTQEIAALRAEAACVRTAASTHVRTGYELVEEERLIGPVRNRVSLAGEVRPSLHHDLAVRIALRGGLGPLVPSVSSYLYYERGDFIALHRDQPSCQVDVLVLLDGSPGPLLIHPELAGLRGIQLRRLALSVLGHPLGGVGLDLRNGPIILRGHEVPHHRLPHVGPESLVLAAFCFSGAQYSGRTGQT